MPRIAKAKDESLRHDPLEKQLRADKELNPERAERKKLRRSRLRGDPEAEEAVEMSSKIAKKIIASAKAQQAEIEDEDSGNEGVGAAGVPAIPFQASRSTGDSSDEEESDYGTDEEEYLKDVEEISPEDEAQLALFMNARSSAAPNVSDVLLRKISEKAGASGSVSGPGSGMNPQIVELYKSVAKVLHVYRSGKIPKPFKILPNLQNWEEILFLTNPDGWSPHAVLKATKLFASNLNSKLAQRFYNLVLLPRVQREIEETHKLSFHIYLALKTAIFKPSAFFKGILLPMVEDGTCTLREAVLVGSVLQKVSIPFQHSGAALVKLASMEYSGATSVFMRILLNKKYNLPYRVIDELVNHFMRFMGEKRELPVLWHQCLLIFVQRYKNDLTEEENDALRTLIHKQRHHQISPEILRELQHAAHRGQTPMLHNIVSERLYTGSGSAMDAMQ